MLKLASKFILGRLFVGVKLDRRIWIFAVVYYLYTLTPSVSDL